MLSVILLATKVTLTGLSALGVTPSKVRSITGERNLYAPRSMFFLSTPFLSCRLTEDGSLSPKAFLTLLFLAALFRRSITSCRLRLYLPEGTLPSVTLPLSEDACGMSIEPTILLAANTFNDRASMAMIVTITLKNFFFIFSRLHLKHIKL